MVVIYDYVNQKRQRGQMDVPTLWAILMATQTHWSNTCGIARCNGSRAIHRNPLDTATGRLCFILPRRPPGSPVKQRQRQNTPCLLAILMAMAMRRYNTTRIVGNYSYRLVS